MELEMVVYSDNSMIEQVANILHDKGYKTAGIRKESIGKQEEENEWHWAKLNMLDSVCVDLFKALGQIVPTEQVEEKPLFRYVAIFIVGDDDDDTEDTTEDTEEEKVNVVLNIGCTTKDGDVMDADNMIDIIGYYHDCTITKTIGFYHGVRENSLKVEIYDVSISNAVDYASFWARCFKQECIALTVNGHTVFVKGSMGDDEHDTMVAELKR